MYVFAFKSTQNMFYTAYVLHYKNSYVCMGLDFLQITLWQCFFVYLNMPTVAGEVLKRSLTDFTTVEETKRERRYKKTSRKKAIDKQNNDLKKQYL